MQKSTIVVIAPRRLTFPTLESISFQQFEIWEEFHSSFRSGALSRVEWILDAREGVIQKHDPFYLQMKHHGRNHEIPVIRYAFENPSDDEKTLVLGLGALGYLTGPADGKVIGDAQGLVNRNQLDPENYEVLRSSYVEEMIEQVGMGKGLLGQFSESSARDLFRLLHTLKGGARSLGFMPLGGVIHHFETFLQRVQHERAFLDAHAVKLLQLGLDYLSTVTETIQSGVQLPEIPFDLLEQQKKWTPSASLADTDSSSTPDSGPVQPSVIVSHGNSLRVTHEKLQTLQGHVKKILQIKTQMSAFSRELSAEFQGEQFPTTLERLVQNLEKEALSFMEFFVALRIVPATRIRPQAEKIIQEASLITGKKVKFDFQSEEYLEIDRQVLDVLSLSLGHLLKNAIDHGLEDEAGRVAAGKSIIGNIRMEVKSVSGSQFEVLIRDDGKGMDPARIRQSVLKKGITDEASLSKMKDEEILQLIFSDGVSTKEQITELSGRGVGLSAVKASIEESGGNIRVRSILGTGTEFLIELPKVFQL